MEHKEKNSTKNLRQFFLLTFAFSWLCWLPGLLLTYGMLVPSQTLDTIQNILQWVGGIGPSLAGLFLVNRNDGKTGIKALFKRVIQFKIGKWYLPTILLLPLAVILGHVINGLIFGAPFPQKEILSEPWWIPVLFAVFFILQFSEELGWRGYALDRLQNRWNALTSSLMLGVVWALWHLPMFLSNGFGQHDNHLPYGQFSITIILTTVLITWLQNNTNGSLVPAFVMHAMFALSGEVLPLVRENTNGQLDYTAWGITNILLTMIVIFVIYKWGYKTLKKD
jgi:membrane protease YdiL (CAAX protease family)